MAGLLDALTWLDQKRKNAANTVRGLLSDPQQELAQMGSYAMQPVSELRQASQDWNSPDPATKQRGQDAMLNALLNMGGVGAIKVFHGSPHTFDKFDMSKIGTGEGAQAYGHGLYFAESPQVAKDYAKRLRTVTVNGKEIPEVSVASGSGWVSNEVEHSAVLDIKKNGYAKALASAEKAAKDDPANPWLFEYLDVIRGLKNKQTAVNSNLYEASLRWPDAAREARDPLGPQHFLNWDAPLSEQPNTVSKGLESLVSKNGPLTGDMAEQVKMLMQNRNASWNTGEALARLFGWDQPELSRVLREQGIPGIRYLDAGSRGAGEGTANYVVFDPNLIEILKRNGQPLGLLNQ